MTFVLLVGLKLKKHHFCKEISDLEQGQTTSQNTLKIAYFVIHFLYPSYLDLILLVVVKNSYG